MSNTSLSTPFGVTVSVVTLYVSSVEGLALEVRIVLTAIDLHYTCVESIVVYMSVSVNYRVMSDIVRHRVMS